MADQQQSDAAPPVLGPNAWLVEEMYEQFRADPTSVSENWRDFFEDYRSSRPEAPAAPAPSAASAPPPSAPPAPPSAPPTPATAPPPAAPLPVAPAARGTGGRAEEAGAPIRGAGALIVTNMERSLGVPTATSFRDIPAKLLEVNRKVINGYLGRSGGGKVSFTHIIAYAVVRTIADDMPAMNATFVEGSDGTPRVVRHEHVNVGIAVDMEKADGTRSLVVPVIKQADALDFAGFRAAYEDLIRRAKTGKLQVTDFQGATLTITNPGTIGTVQSVPRLMPGQGVIVGVGSIDYPAAWQGADERAIGELAVSKVVTLTSTYDHRIIQGAESGMFLKAVHERLLGEHGFYHDVFRALGVPYEEVHWRRDVSPLDREEALLHKQMQVATLIRAYRARGHRIADLDPLDWKEPAMPDELDPGHLRPDDLGPRPGVPHRRRGRQGAHAARRAAGRAARRLLPLHRHRVHAHPGHRRAALDPVEGRRASSSSSTPTGCATCSSGSTPPRRWSGSWPPSTSAPSASVSKARSRPSPSWTPSCPRPPTRTSTARSSAWPTAAG